MGQKNLPFHPPKLSTSGKPLCAVVKTELERQAWILTYIIILHNPGVHSAPQSGMEGDVGYSCGTGQPTWPTRVHRNPRAEENTLQSGVLLFVLAGWVTGFLR